ncbi:alpha/beta hydrolase [Ruegeria sp. MALMAid1280]|uniref:alpha/beta hydrolase n=1 Tax=Ruegeria sp. MALMAid1280 TaxID=3411634 RepID=UPI003B9E42BE
MPSPEMQQALRHLFELNDEAPPNPSLQDMRQGFDALWSSYPPQAGIDPVMVSAGGVPAAWLTAPDADKARVILYLHGGGFRVGSIRSHLAITSRLTGAAKTQVLALDYRLAPEHAFPAQIDDTVAAYSWLLDQGFSARHMAIVGDSAGGGLVVTAMLRLQQLELPFPACAVAISPWTDLVGDGGWRDADPSIDPVASSPVLDEIVADYLAGADPHDGLVSPIFADLAGLPPLLVQVGTQEILLRDATRLADRAREAGVDVTLEIEEGAFHVWHHTAPVVPEATAAIERIGAFILGHLK